MRLLILAFILFSAPAFAQYRTIRGTVHDPNNNQLENVYIQTGDVGFITHSNSSGYFRITFPDTLTYLIFQKTGFQKTIHTLSQSDTLDIELPFANYLDLSLEELLQEKISTVTLKEQDITEVPGIASILTRDELRNMGIRTIREALLLVPGFSPLQNDDEQILSVRGIYGTTNQKILVMRDGHALNEGNLDIPPTEYSLSIENIKKIEIIRGPGASIYGNSAVAAVVNIITLDSEVSNVKIGAGNYGQLNADMVINRNIDNNSSFLIFSRYANTHGQSYDINVQDKPESAPYPGKYYTNRYPRNFDAGFKYTTKTYSAAFNTQKHQYQTYWTSKGTYTNTDSLDAQPELIKSSVNGDILVTPSVSDQIHVYMRHYTDYCQLTNYRLIAPIDTVKYLHGNIQANQWNVIKSGINYHATYDYSEKGQVTVGISYEYRKYMSSWIMANTDDSSKIVLSKLPFFTRGNESREAAFFQIQHTLTPWLQLVAGGRYDIAENFNETFNPRLALLFYPFRPITCKLIYTKAFQAPGYSYRTSNAAFSGSIEQLQPERLETWQGSLRYNFQKNSFLEIAAYYNKMNNLISRIEGKYYANYGKMASYGLEAEGRYNNSVFSLFANYTLTLPDTAHIDDKFRASNISGNRFKFIPYQSGNAGVTLRAFPLVNVSVYGQYYSAFKVQNNEELPQRLLLNATLSVNEAIPNTILSFSAYNLTNKHYKLGDASVTPIEQPGLWYMFSIIYNFTGVGY
jgi:iron complex outermembrane receptor protein